MLARIEVMRIAARVEDRTVEREARRMFRGISLLRVDDAIVAAAAAIKPTGLRSLDAIHLATVQAFGHHLGGMVVYDRRLAAAARDLGIAVWAPS
jgi:predicted nucleic acid-binding protein